MSRVRVFSGTRHGAAWLFVICFSSIARAQTPPPVQAPAQQHEGHTMPAEPGSTPMPAAREGSGTAWLPDETPMYAIHASRGAWSLMFHENVFLQYLRDAGPRGDRQAGSINWVMGMAQRPIGSGRIGLRGMFSLEPWSIRGCGYPDLLATGEQCDGEKIHDLQHPHDLFMELAADYTATLNSKVSWQLYAAAAGEPALGPVAYPHRLSAMVNPLAPIAHHWLDSTHITFGVVTAGVYGPRWKAEASAFNGREPDETRTNIDFAALDSFSGRFWFLPSARVALQLSAGHLKDAEAAEGHADRVDVDRVTASVTYHRVFRGNSVWASTVGWGRNEEGHHASHALLGETSLTFDQRDSWYGRAEVTRKTAHDLDIRTVSESFTVGKLQAGYTRYLAAQRGFQAGVGAGASAGIVPAELVAVYGSRANVGFGIYLTLRPAAMMH